jgi:lipopolysaccharide export system permease protein
LSSGRLLQGLFLVAGWFAVLTFLLGEYVAPPAEQAATQLQLKERGRTARDLRSGLWVRDEQSFINVRLVLSDTRLRGIRIYEFDQQAKLRSVIEAAEGEYVAADGWRLSEVVQTILDDNTARVEKRPEMLWRSALNPDILSVLMVSPDRMSLRHLAAYTRHLSENHQNTSRYDIAFWKKTLYPLAALVMVSLALPFAAGP